MTTRIFDTSGNFVVPDDMNQPKTLWGLKFTEPVSLKRLLDAIAELPGGDIIYLDVINDADGNVKFNEEDDLK